MVNYMSSLPLKWPRVTKDFKVLLDSWLRKHRRACHGFLNSFKSLYFSRKFLYQYFIGQYVPISVNLPFFHSLATVTWRSMCLSLWVISCSLFIVIAFLQLTGHKWVKRSRSETEDQSHWRLSNPAAKCWSLFETSSKLLNQCDIICAPIRLHKYNQNLLMLLTNDRESNAGEYTASVSFSNLFCLIVITWVLSPIITC